MQRSKDWHCKIAMLYRLKWSISAIAVTLRTTENTVLKSIKIHSETTNWYDFIVGVSFGNKKEAYYTEEEMLNGYKPPKYSELSEEEKAIYNSL